ncbi:uncharacterized protein [Branchiostoma lanceolatum]|uniref:uncharacterized protein n=1 Tax=Branchiostoma lanceolatum TaxID=7740 RepID=UPI003455ADA3
MIHLQFPQQEHGVLSQLNTMRLQGQLCDVSVLAGGQKFHCHQAVLAASSGHFHGIFVQGVLCFPKRPTIETLDLSFISAEVFSVVLDYIYTSNLHCPTGIIADVLQAAKTLEIEPLVRQLPVFVGTAPISSLNGAPSLSVETPQPSRTIPSVVSASEMTMSSVVSASRMTVPESLVEMLTEPEENSDQSASQSAMGDVVVKQELLDPLEASQDPWSSPGTSLPPIPHLSLDNGEREHAEMMSWTAWVNDEYSRRLGAEKIADLEQNCRRCARKDNSVRWYIRTLKEWCLSRNKSPDFETLPPDQLSRLLQQFYYELRNPSGGRYSGHTMLGFRSTIKTYLLNHPAKPTFDITHDSTFSAANKTLLKVVKECPIGFEVGIKAISFPDLQKLFDSGTLGTSTPNSLQRLIWFYFTVHFHVKTTNEWLMLKKKDLTLHNQGRKDAYFTLRRPVKGGQQIEDRMYATGGPLCPVAVTKLYLKRLNTLCNSLLQKPVRGRLARSGRWFKEHPPGQNYLVYMMKGISIDAGLSLTYTNNRIRSTTRQDLVRAGIFQTLVASGAGGNHALGATTLLHTLGQSLDMATPTSQQVVGMPGSPIQSHSLPGGFAEDASGQQAHVIIKQAIELHENLSDNDGDWHPSHFNPVSEIKEQPRKGVRRSTRKRMLGILLEDANDDDDDRLPE